MGGQSSPCLVRSAGSSVSLAGRRRGTAEWVEAARRHYVNRAGTKQEETMGGEMNPNYADKIVAAIERNTEAIDKFRSEVGSVSLWLFFILIVLIAGVGCPRAKASVLLPPLEQYAFTDIGTPPAPPPNPNVQYWYTMDVPGPDGVLPVEVFAPRLVAQVASEPQGVKVETPEPGTWFSVLIGIPLGWIAYSWMRKRKQPGKWTQEPTT